ncbi:hypothetical protein P7C70_g7264, partial [Phenoliferia sp. Uapishka_3]
MSSPSHPRDSTPANHTSPARRTLSEIGDARLSETPPNVYDAVRYTTVLCANQYRQRFYHFDQDSSDHLTSKLGEAANQLTIAFWQGDEIRIRAIGRYLKAGTKELATRIEELREVRRVNEEHWTRVDALAEERRAGSDWDDRHLS